MTPEVEKIHKKKNQLFADVFGNKIPERVPINVSMHLNVVAGFAGVPAQEAVWNSTLLTEAALKLAERIPTDVCIYAGSNLSPGFFQSMGARTRVLSSTGFMQHPNTVGLLPEEYDIFIKNPIDCIVEVVIPRNLPGLDFHKDPVRTMFAAAQSMALKEKHLARERQVQTAVREKFGGFVPAPGSRGACFAPLDILTDNLRSLSGMSLDIRRMPDKVEAAVNAIYPINYMIGIPPRAANGLCNFPLHIGHYMREKDFERLFWKPLMRQMTDYASMGLHTQLFCEYEWDRLVNYLQDVPVDTVLQFEKIDPRLAKDKLGKKCILTGNFPLDILRTSTKQECIDKTREYLDIMMPGGRFIFQFNMQGLTHEDYNLENLQAVCETVLEHGVYKNAGEKAAGPEFKQSDYTHSQVAPITSKYLRTWEQYKELNPLTPESAKQEVMDQEEMILRYLYSLCQ